MAEYLDSLTPWLQSHAPSRRRFFSLRRPGCGRSCSRRTSPRRRVGLHRMPRLLLDSEFSLIRIRCELQNCKAMLWIDMRLLVVASFGAGRKHVDSGSLPPLWALHSSRPDKIPLRGLDHRGGHRVCHRLSPRQGWPIRSGLVEAVHRGLPSCLQAFTRYSVCCCFLR